MKQRLLTGWNLIRILYLIIGISVIGQSSAQHHWLGIILGVYLSAMGLFAFGCASGNCYQGNCDVEEKGS